MKKLLFIILVLSLTVSLTSCRDKKAQNKVEHRIEKVKEVATMLPKKCLIRFRMVPML